MENTVAPNNYGTRADGTPKGNGYLGPLPMTDGSGKVITEMSVGVNIDGQEVEIPTVVPTLSEEEKSYLQSGGEPTDAIVQKAVDFAKQRKSEGKGYFAEQDWQDEYTPEPTKAEQEPYLYTDAPMKIHVPNAAKKHVNGIHKALKAADRGDDIVKNYADGALDNKHVIVDNVQANTDDSIKDRVYSLTTLGDTAPEATAGVVQQNLAHISADEGMKPYIAYVRSMGISKKMSNEEIEEAASQAYRQDLAAQVWDEVSTSDAVKDFAQMILLPTDNWKMKKLADYIGVETGVWDWVSKGSFVNKFMDRYQQLPPKSKAVIANDIVRNWETIGGFDNKVELMGFLARMEGMDDVDRAMTYFEGFTDTVAIVGAPLKAVKIATNATRMAGSAAAARRIGKVVSKMQQKADIVETAIQKSGVLQRAATLEAPDLIADLATAGAQGKLTEAGIDTVTAANTMTPFDTVKMLTPGAPEKQAAIILKRQQVLDEIVENAKMLNLPMDEAGRAEFIERTMARIEDADEVVSAKVVEATPDGFKLSVETLTGEVPYEHSFKYTDVGTWEDLRYRHAGVVGSPKFKLPGIARDIVDTIQYGLNKGSKLKGEFDRIIKSSRKPLSRVQSERVDALLTFGEGKKEYSYIEAVQQGVHGLKLTEDEYQAYAATRQVFDSLRQLKESEILADWSMRNVKMFELNGSRHFGKVYDDVAGAKTGAGNVDGGIHAYLKDGKLVKGELTAKEIDDLYKQNYRLVRANGSDIYHAGGEAADWAVVRMNELANPSGPILNMIPGYVTRISQEGNFFLKKKNVIKVGGKERIQWTTIGYDNIHSDLEAHRLTLKDPDNYKVFADREMSRVDYNEDVIQSFGGLYKGSRASTPPVYGLGKKQAKYAPVLESLQRYIQNVSRNQPIAIYREGLRQKWINTAVKNGMISEYDAATKSFAELGGMLNKHHDKYHFFDRSHKEVQFISGIRTLDETEWDARIYALGRWAEKRGWTKPMASFFYNGNLQKIDSALMAGTYQTLLGFGNMAQIPLQFSASLIPVALNPIAGAKGLLSALGMTVMDYMADFGKISHAKTNKVDVNLWNLWNESGMRDATKYATFDYYGMFNDTPYKATFFQKMMAKSDAPVRIGQMGANRVAFATAYHFVADKLKRTPTMDDILEISARADEYLLNMGRGNMAGFQRGGAAKYAGMFMQVQTKFIEKIFGSEFTALEKGRLITAQAAMFGAQGLPFVGSIGNRLLAACGYDVESTDADTLSRLQKGMFGWYMTDYLGTNAEFSGRFALGTDIAEKCLAVALSPTSMIDAIGGAPWSVVSRGWNVLDKAMFAGRVAWKYDDVTPSLALATGQVIAQELAKFPASTANLIKGVTMYKSGLYSDKNGIPVFMYRDPSLLPAITQAFGFQNLEAQDWYQMNGSSLFSKPEAKTTLAKSMAGLMLKLINADADRQDVYAMAYNALASMALRIPGGEDINEEVIKHLSSGPGNWEEQWSKGIKDINTEYTENMDELFKVLNIQSSVELRRELEKHGVK